MKHDEDDAPWWVMLGEATISGLTRGVTWGLLLVIVLQLKKLISILSTLQLQ